MLALIPLLPFLGFLVNATLGKRLGKAVSGGLASLAMVTSFAVAATSVWNLAGMAPSERAVQETLYTWIAAGDFSVDVEYDVNHEQSGTIVVQDDDAAGTGTPPHQVHIPVVLTP